MFVQLFIAALEAGFTRAFGTIFDSHVTTFVAGMLMFALGSGPVKGFAVTLSFGLFANLFTAVFVSRVIFDWLLTRKQRGEALSIEYPTASAEIGFEPTDWSGWKKKSCAPEWR